MVNLVEKNISEMVSLGKVIIRGPLQILKNGIGFHHTSGTPDLSSFSRSFTKPISLLLPLALLDCFFFGKGFDLAKSTRH